MEWGGIDGHGVGWVGWGGVECGRMAWDGIAYRMEWICTGLNEIWDGMGWDRIEWNRIE